jgi:hypothetical protein
MLKQNFLGQQQLTLPADYGDGVNFGRLSASLAAQVRLLIAMEEVGQELGKSVCSEMHRDVFKAFTHAFLLVKSFGVEGRVAP